MAQNIGVLQVICRRLNINVIFMPGFDVSIRVFYFYYLLKQQ